jgi:hypothetical protein
MLLSCTESLVLLLATRAPSLSAQVQGYAPSVQAPLAESRASPKAKRDKALLFFAFGDVKTFSLRLRRREGVLSSPSAKQAPPFTFGSRAPKEQALLFAFGEAPNLCAFGAEKCKPSYLSHRDF